VDTLDLVSADNGVLEGGAILEDEDGVLIAAFLLAAALDATAVGLHTAVEGAADGLGGGVGHAALGGGDGEGGALVEGLVGGGIMGGGKGRGEEEREEKKRLIHCDD
jgi:hypothetical protein